MASSGRYNLEKELIELINRLVNEIKTFSGTTDQLKDKLADLKEVVDELFDIITGTGDSPSILTRMALVEKAIEDLEEEKKADTAGKWQMYVALIMGATSMLTALITLIFK